MLFYAMLLDISLALPPIGGQQGETVELLIQRGFVKVTSNKHTHMHASMCIHMHTNTLSSTAATGSPTPLGVKTQKLNAACLWFLI